MSKRPYLGDCEGGAVTCKGGALSLKRLEDSLYKEGVARQTQHAVLKGQRPDRWLALLRYRACCRCQARVRRVGEDGVRAAAMLADHVGVRLGPQCYS